MTVSGEENPQVLYIGLQKTGSTLLRAYFTAHPDILWTREAHRLQSTGLLDSYPRSVREALTASVKQTPAGTRPRVWVDMYESLGMGYSYLGSHRWSGDLMLSSGTIRGSDLIDVAPVDLFEHIRGTLPGVRVLLTIRHQLEWIFSNYHHFVRLMNADRRSFEDFLGTIEGRIVMATARFDRLVEQLHAAFGRENVLVIPLEAIETQPEQTLQRLCGFLRVPYVSFVPNEADFNRGIDRLYGEGRSVIELSANPPANASPRERVLDRLRWTLLGRKAEREPDGGVPSKTTLRRDFGGLLAPVYAVGNVRLAQLVEFDLATLGYPV